MYWYESQLIGDHNWFWRRSRIESNRSHIRLCDIRKHSSLVDLSLTMSHWHLQTPDPTLNEGNRFPHQSGIPTAGPVTLQTLYALIICAGSRFREPKKVRNVCYGRRHERVRCTMDHALLLTGGVGIKFRVSRGAAHPLHALPAS